MKKLLLLALALGTTTIWACTATPPTSVDVKNNNGDADINEKGWTVITKTDDGTTLYRTVDHGEHVYFSSGGTMTVVSCGKNCERPVTTPNSVGAGKPPEPEKPKPVQVEGVINPDGTVTLTTKVPKPADTVVEEPNQ
jgi:hypothetical protein